MHLVIRRTLEGNYWHSVRVPFFDVYTFQNNKKIVESQIFHISCILVKFYKLLLNLFLFKPVFGK